MNGKGGLREKEREREEERERWREREKEKEREEENTNINTTLGELEIDGRLIRKFRTRKWINSSYKP